MLAQEWCGLRAWCNSAVKVINAPVEENQRAQILGRTANDNLFVPLYSHQRNRTWSYPVGYTGGAASYRPEGEEKEIQKDRGDPRSGLGSNQRHTAEHYSSASGNGTEQPLLPKESGWL